MNVLVTGASGFIGSQIASQLANLGNEVLGLYKKNYPTRLEHINNLSILQADIRQPLNIARKVDYVIHAAAATPANTDKDNELKSTNEKGIRQLLDWSASVKASKFFFCSTMAVYGEIKDDWIHEGTPSRSPNTYGATKLAAEQFLRNWVSTNKHCRAITVRLPGVVGLESKDTFIPRTVQNITTGKPASVFSKKSLFNNILHINDLVNFINNWGQNNQHEPRYDCINAASTNPISLEQVAYTLMKGLRRNVSVVENRNGRPPFLIKTEKAQSHNFPLNTTIGSLEKYASEIYSVNATSIKD